jgi:hypothetical protein
MMEYLTTEHDIFLAGHSQLIIHKILQIRLVC